MAGHQPAIQINTIQIIHIIRRTVSFHPVQLDGLEALCPNIATDIYFKGITIISKYFHIFLHI
jgi:hypothetical protein